MTSQTRWKTPRETTGKRRRHGPSITPFDPFLTKVERVRLDLESGCYPFVAHLNAAIERLVNILLQEKDAS